MISVLKVFIRFLQAALGFTVSPIQFPRVREVKSVMGDCLHDRLLTVGVFYSQQKQAIDDTLASSRSDTASTETRERNSVVHQRFTNLHLNNSRDFI